METLPWREMCTRAGDGCTSGFSAESAYTAPRNGAVAAGIGAGDEGSAAAPPSLPSTELAIVLSHSWWSTMRLLCSRSFS